MSIQEWLRDLSENYHVEVIDGKVELVKNDGRI